MKGFEDVTLTWKGQSHTIPADRQLLLIAKIEDALTQGSGGSAVVALTQNGGPSHARLAMAYGAALRHAGASVSDDEVYLSIMNDLASGNADVAGVVQGAVLALLAIVAPPIYSAIVGDVSEEGGEEKKDQGAG